MLTTPNYYTIKTIFLLIALQYHANVKLVESKTKQKLNKEKSIFLIAINILIKFLIPEDVAVENNLILKCNPFFLAGLRSKFYPDPLWVQKWSKTSCTTKIH